jgi:hypothetical protein
MARSNGGSGRRHRVAIVGGGFGGLLVEDDRSKVFG